MLASEKGVGAGWNGRSQRSNSLAEKGGLFLTLSPLVPGGQAQDWGKDRGRSGEGFLINFTLRNKSRAEDPPAFPVTFSKGLRDHPHEGAGIGELSHVLEPL